MAEESNSGCGLSGTLYFIFSVITGMIGKEIHGSTLWAIIDWLMCPFAWAKWLICGEVNISIIKEALGFFFQ